MVTTEDVKAFGLKIHVSKHTNDSVFDIVTGANNPESTIPNIDPDSESFESILKEILDTTVEPPAKMKDRDDYKVTINIKEGGHVDKDGKLVQVSLLTKDFKEALVWRKILLYVTKKTSESKTKEEHYVSGHGS